MIELEKFIKMGLDIDGIKRNTGVSAHTLKSLASVQLQKLGIKNVEYELLVRILTKQNKLHEFEELTPLENKIVAKIAQGVSYLRTGSYVGEDGIDSLCTAPDNVGKGVQDLSDGFEKVRKAFGMSSDCLKSQLRQILGKLWVKDVEYTLLCEVCNSHQTPNTSNENE